MRSRMALPLVFGRIKGLFGRGCLAFATLVGLAAGLPRSAPAQDAPNPEIVALRRELANLQVGKIEAVGRLRGLERLEQVLRKEPVATAGGVDFLGHPDLWKLVARTINENEVGRNEKLTEFESRIDKQREKAESTWRSLASKDASFNRQSPEKADPPPSPERIVLKVIRGSLPLAALGVIAVLATVAILLLDNRRQIRAWRRSFGGLIMIPILAVVGAQAAGCSATSPAQDSGAGATPPEDERARLVREKGELEVALKAALKEAESKEKAVKVLEAQILRARVRQVLPIGEPKDPKDAAAAVESMKSIEVAEGEGQDLIHRIVVKAGEADEFAADGQARVKTQIGAWAARRDAVLAERLGDQIGAGIGVVLSLACLMAVIVPLRRSRVKREVEKRLSAEQCPRCLDRNLALVESELFTGANRAVERVECRNPECMYIVDASYQEYSRLALPTLGVKNSGKTRWLLSVYEKIVNGKVPQDVKIQNLPSRYDGEFARMVQEYLEVHSKSSPTLVEFPSPLIFYHSDRDRLAPNDVLLNMFDYSGEAMFMTLAETEGMRRRALLSDSFVLFLDPTQVMSPPIDSEHTTLAGQVQSFNRFCDDVKVVNGLRPGELISRSVAVCIPKIDMLLRHNPMGGVAYDWVGHLRASADLPITLDLIRQRSDFVAQAFPMMFPGVDIEAKLRMNFGKNYMFFPISSVGIDEAGMGEEDLTRRQRRAFGVMEPLFWLLHVHGYNVFDT